MSYNSNAVKKPIICAIQIKRKYITTPAQNFAQTGNNAMSGKTPGIAVQ